MGWTDDVTDEGINYLCASKAPHGKCKNLTELQIKGCLSVTEKGIKTALLNLPLLEKIKGNKKTLKVVEE
jgi:hypothetical protein